ncbi:MAG TPA: M50 family metallopeptidase [Gaiellaceae bacterium]|nr:M50 family metallopeptidase [Gaiellaceae bacterium]
MSIFVSLLGLAFLILIHEAGHFFVARGVRMNPRKFYLGFPPAIVKTKRNGIEYGVGAIPLGGYVKIPGMHRPAAGDLDYHFARAIEEAPPLGRSVGDLRRHLEENDYAGAVGALERVRAALPDASLSPLAQRSAERGLSEIQDSLAPDAYWRAPTWKRVAVIFAGPAANLVLAIVIFAALFMSLSGSYRLGFELRGTTDSVTATVNDVLADSPAAAAGIQAGDRIVAIDGKQVDGESIRPTIQDSRGAPVTVTVERNGKTVELQPVRPEKSEEFGVVGAVGESFQVTWEVTQEIGRSVGRLVTGDGSDVSSPVGIVQGSSEAVDQGTDTYLWVLGLISLSLALLNLLPLLPLDGGHIAFSLIEGIRGRAVAREVYERVSVVGIAVVLLLFFIGLTNDIGRLGS